MRWIALTVAVLASTAAWAQKATIQIVNQSGAIVSTQVYDAACAKSPKIDEVLPIVNPVEAYVDDPADESKDCQLLIAAQVSQLPPASGYRASASWDGLTFTDLSSPFAVTQKEPPPPAFKCFDGSIEYNPNDTHTWQWKPNQVEANKSRLIAEGWVFQAKPVKTNKAWQWWQGVCVGLLQQ